MTPAIYTLAITLAVPAFRPAGELHSEHFVFRYSAGARQDAQRLFARAEDVRRRVMADLQKGPRTRTEVRIVTDRAQWTRAQPHGHRLPGWVAGVAYPRLNLIVLGPPGIGGRGVDRHALFAHEYSHVALAHAVNFRRLPRWFVEGFADLQAMAPWLQGPLTPGGAGAQPLGSLHRNLGDDHRAASRSYRQSYDFVRFLRGQGDPGSFRRLIALLGRGVAFDAALQRVYGMRKAALESKWRRRWNWTNVIVPMITSGFFLWVIAAMLLIIGFARRRRQRLAEIQAMDDPDDGLDDDLPVVYGDGRNPWQSDDSEPAAAPAGGDGSLISPGTLFLGIAAAVVLTALLASIWPYTRLWLLAGPAAVVVVIALRWASRT